MDDTLNFINMATPDLGDDTKQINVLYIGGYGRSGSTLLEKLLTTHPNIIGGGEIFRMAEIFSNPSAMCTCGKTLIRCPIWGPVRKRTEKEANNYGGFLGLDRALKTLEGRSFLPLSPDDKVIKTWTFINKLAYEALLTANPTATWVVDSSKTARGAAFRPDLLVKHKYNLQLICLVRQAQAVLASVKHGSNREMEEGIHTPSRISHIIRAYLGWVLATVAGEKFSQSSTSQFFHLHFEDLTHDPDLHLYRILSWMGLSFYSDWEARLIDTPRHMIGGNRNRFVSEKVKRNNICAKHDYIGGLGLHLARILSKFGIL